MRKYSMIMMAFALLLGMAQCKKEPTNTNNGNTERVDITLKVDNGNNGDRLNVYPVTGAVIFTEGDEIYVGNNGKYVGTLTYGEGLFQGTISGDLSTSDYLHFYFVGNKPTSPAALTSGSTTSCTVDISDQTAYLPVISYAPSKAKYSPSTTFYTAQLLNKSALVKFVPSEPTALPITVSGLKNEVQIDFANHTLAPSGTTDGITLYSVSDTEKWAILLAQEAVSDAKVTIRGYDASASLPTITNNMYYNSGVGIAMTATVPAGAIDGKFTINSNGDQVYFSKGNLQYTKSTSVWSFMENQYDIVETLNQWVGNDYAGQDVVSLFCYGTSGYNYGATVYQPWSTTNRYADCCGSNLYDINQADWGYNAIANGGNKENSGWRTLTRNEWSYLFNTRTASTVNNVANARYAKAQVAGVHGVILFPDSYTHPNAVGLPTGINATGDAGWNGNNYTADDFELMEVNGAVFLPAAGYRLGDPWVYYVGSDLQYWTSYFSGNNNGSEAASVNISSSGLNPSGTAARSFGLSVRLVRNVQ